VIDKRSLPTELTQLPIFQVIGNQIPTNFSQPETRKQSPQIVFWGALIGAIWFFYTMLPKLIAFCQPDYMVDHYVHYHRGIGHVVP
jgi:hypothetical protein